MWAICVFHYKKVWQLQKTKELERDDKDWLLCQTQLVSLLCKNCSFWTNFVLGMNGMVAMDMKKWLCLVHV